MSEMNRREALALMSFASLAASCKWQGRGSVGGAFTPEFFTDHEYRTVQVLVDLILPRDERSGSATDAGVAEFIDFTVNDRENMQTPIRGGLAWLDDECLSRFEKLFADCEEEEQTQVLDDIAWPDRADPEMEHGVSFFNRMRDLTASGFWSSKMGVEDLRYMGNTPLAEWNGCPEEQLEKLGVSYEDDNNTTAG